MRIAWLAFTAQGAALARRLAGQLGGTPRRCGEDGVTLAGWTADAFAAADALVFVGAVGIAVRAIAPHCRSKAADPAVVAVDECAHFAVPLLSGHLGGANDLARQIAALCGAQAVITTATDANGVFAVDEWARRQGCAVLNPERIKAVSGALLAGRTVHVCSAWPVEGAPPAGVELAAPGAEEYEVHLGLRRGAPGALWLAPRCAVLGVGCRKGAPQAALEEAFAAFCAAERIAPACICAAASIDLKQQEPGLLAFCKAHGWPLRCYSAQQLREQPGQFTPSAFVQRVTGVENVCERAAVCASGGEVVIPKRAGGGVTLALALSPFAPNWRWQQ